MTHGACEGRPRGHRRADSPMAVPSPPLRSGGPCIVALLNSGSESKQASIQWRRQSSGLVRKNRPRWVDYPLLRESRSPRRRLAPEVFSRTARRRTWTASTRQSITAASKSNFFVGPITRAISPCCALSPSTTPLAAATFSLAGGTTANAQRRSCRSHCKGDVELLGGVGSAPYNLLTYRGPRSVMPRGAATRARDLQRLASNALSINTPSAR